MRKRIATFVAVLAILSGTVYTGVALAANPSADLDQCANDPATSPSTDGCNNAANQWVNGNLGASKSVYFEGDSIPYRMRFGNLGVGGSNTVTIEWDTTKAGKHAIDYIDDFNESVLNANPCLGVNGCDPASFTSFNIPADPQVTGAGVTPLAGAFRLYGGTINSVSTYSYANGAGFTGDKSARITITFTPSRANPVLAWGGHIARRVDWGASGSAVAIPGSPYHTRLIDLNGSGGNQDRSLSAAAVIFPSSIKIVKEATPEGSTSFGFTASPSPLANFSLVDDGTSTNTKLFSMISNFQAYTVTESTPPSGWGFDSASCSVAVSNGGSANVSGPAATINLNEGEDWTCTYLNSRRTGTLKVIKHVVNDAGGTAAASAWSIHVKSGTTEVTGSPQAGSETGTVYTLTGGSYTVSETSGPASGYSFISFTGDCDASGVVTVVEGQQKTCTLTNSDDQATITVVKLVDNSNGGDADPDDFSLTLEGNPVLSGVANNVDPGTYTAGETLLPGYSFTNFSGDCDTSGDTTVALGEHKTCYLSNDDNQATITVVKVVNNDSGGTAQPDDFDLTLDGTAVTSGVAVPVAPGTYTAGETLLDGYTFDGFSDDCDENGSITVALGEAKTCTLTNSDDQATITVVKVVNNDSGGTAEPDDFDLTLEGDAVLSGVAVDVDPGTYTAGETLLDGYTFDGFTGDCDANGDITVALGESKTCTLTNSDDQATITVVKVVNNTHGLTAGPDDFLLTLEGDAVLSGVPVNVDPGTYTAGETLLDGYTFDGFTGDCDLNGDVTVALGESKTCTLTNSDTPATPNIATDVDAQIRDNVTITGRGTPTGTVDFSLYDNAACEGDPVGQDLAVGLIGGSATSKWFDITETGTYFWQIHYSGDQQNAERTGPCEEEIDITSDAFDPIPASLTLSLALPMLAWALWSRRRREEGAAA